MIKLIASDMDGTLLDENKRLPREFFGLLSRLGEKGVTFVAASGRSYCTLKENFAPHSDQLTYICDNGACVVEHGVMTETDSLDRRDILAVLEACQGISHINLILCGAQSAHVLPYSKEFIDEVDRYYVNRALTQDLAAVQDDIFKIAICDRSNAARNSYPILKPLFEERLELVVSGEWWMDVMNKGVSKGAALKKLQRRLGVSPEETMVFGDFYNDVEMLRQAKYSFVMENANEDMKQYGNFIAKSNREHGVLQAIEEHVFHSNLMDAS